MPRRRAFGTIKTRKGKPGFYVEFVWQGREYQRASVPRARPAAAPPRSWRRSRPTGPNGDQIGGPRGGPTNCH